MTSMMTTSIVWKAGKNTYVVTVPIVIRNAQNIQEGDLVEVSFNLIKKGTEKITKEDKPTIARAQEEIKQENPSMKFGYE